MDRNSMRLRGRIGGYALAASRDMREHLAPARAAFMRRFVDEVDPDRVLTEAERNRRAEMAKKAYFSRLAYKSAKTRAKKRERAERRRETKQAFEDRA